MTLEIKILQAIADRPLPGLELAQKLDRRFLWMKLDMPPYPALYRMERDGLITGYFDESSRPGVGLRRKYYAITRLGKNKLEGIKFMGTEIQRVNRVLPSASEANEALKSMSLNFLGDKESDRNV